MGCCTGLCGCSFGSAVHCLCGRGCLGCTGCCIGCTGLCCIGVSFFCKTTDGFAGCCGMLTCISGFFDEGISTVISGCERLGGAASGLSISGRASLTSSFCIGERCTAGVFIISLIDTSLSSCMGGKTVCSCSFASCVRGTAGVLAISERLTGLSSCMGGSKLSSPVGIPGR